MPDFPRTVLRLTVLTILLMVLALALRPPTSSANVAAANVSGRSPAGSGVETLELVGHFGGTAHTVFALNDLVLAGLGPELAIFDGSDPTHLIRLEYLMFEGTVNHIQASGSHAFVGVGNGVHVVDVSNPAAPTIVGFYQSPGYVFDMVIEGEYLYVTAGTAGLRIVDISDPLLPVEVGFLSAAAEVTAVDASNHLAFIGDNGLRIIDVANPATPFEIGYYQQGGITDVTVAGNYAYLVHGDLTILDVSDPTSPFLAGQYLSGNYSLISHVAVRDNYAFLVRNGCIHSGQCTAWLVTLDVSNPAAPVEQGAYGTDSDYTHAIALAGDYAYIAADIAGLQIMDISQPTEPLGVGYYSRFWNISGLQAISRPYLFVGGYFEVWTYGTLTGYQVVDIVDPHQPVERTFIGGSGLHLAEEYAYVHGGDRYTSSLHALDITDPTHPVGTGSWYTYQTFASNVLFGDTYIYANGDFQTVALDKSSLAQIATHEEITVVYNRNGLVYANQGGDLYVYTPPFAEVNVVADLTINNLQVIGRYGYAIGGNLRILDMINPVEPVVVGSLELPGSNIWGVHISSDYAYMPTDAYEVVIVDVSDPAAPVQVGSYPTADYYPSMLVVGSYLYVTDGTNGIVVLDVSNPAAPVPVAVYPKPYPGDMVVNGTHLYAGYGADGIYAFKLYGIDRRFYLPLVTQGQ